MLWLAFGIVPTRANSYVLGTSALVVGPNADTNSVVLAVTPSTGAWTATTNDSWLHLDLANQSGAGSTNVIFSYDTNSGPTRVGTLMVGDQTLTVTQAGSGFVSARPASVVFFQPVGLGNLAVDSSGNVYIPVAAGPGGPGPENIYELTPSNGVSTYLGIPGLNQPDGVAVDGLGNVFIADTGNNAVEEWPAGGGNLITLVSSNLSYPEGVAVDSHDNVFIADAGNGAIKEWSAASSNVTTLVPGLGGPQDVAVDIAGNLYMSDSGVIKEWIAANSNVVTLATANYGPSGVAVDGSGNVYAGIPGNGVDLPTYLLKWSAGDRTAVQLFVPPNDGGVAGVAVNGTGDIYFTDPRFHYVYVLPNTFVDITARTENLASGTDSWPALLPVTANSTATSDQPWLTIDGISNGVLTVSFTADTNGVSRTANITLLGQKIPVTQGTPSFSLGTNLLFEGPAAGADSVVLTANSPTAIWTATANASWLHVNPGSQSGTGSAAVDFTFDANPGVTSRSGTLTIASQALTVTQSGVSFLLGTNTVVEVDSSGSDSVVLTAASQTVSWTATANVSWLHLSAANQSGTGSGTVDFTFDANQGPSRVRAPSPSRIKH